MLLAARRVSVCDMDFNIPAEECCPCRLSIKLEGYENSLFKVTPGHPDPEAAKQQQPIILRPPYLTFLWNAVHFAPHVTGCKPFKMFRYYAIIPQNSFQKVLWIMNTSVCSFSQQRFVLWNSASLYLNLES